MADSTEVADRPDQAEYLLTTIDNPYNPFENWDEWYQWDERSGYCTCGLIDRVLNSSSELSEADQYAAWRDAIDEIVRENLSGKHIRIQRGDPTLVGQQA